MDDKLKKIIFIVLGCFVVLFLFLFLMSSCDRKVKPSVLETMMVEKAKNYYEIHKEELPKNNSSITLALGDLVAKGMIDELDKILEDNTSCSGTLIIENNNDYYMYSPKLNCTSPTETYTSTKLKDVILDDVVTAGNGLYNINGEYYYRGENVDNYVLFDGLLWRIVKINNDNTIKLIENGRREPVVWDDRYNEQLQSNVGMNNYYYNSLSSRIMDELKTLYNKEDYLTNDAKGFLKESKLCIGKRTIEDSTKDGVTECTETLDNQYLGLITVNEYMIASLDDNCNSTISNACGNYNYLANFVNSYWTLTANAANSHQVYKVNATVINTTASSSGMARVVVNISENTNITGKGTLEEPYKVAGLQTELRKQ